MKKIFFISLFFLIITGCNKDNKETEKSGDKSIESFYKQFDTTLSKDKADSLKTALDSVYRWRDVKNKR